jgi:3D-(3,5/4)-trihydroxycyclohexane-1,2-dione acylhydrolase (decyclizing)
MQDSTTRSWTAFDRDACTINLNAACLDASKHMSIPVVADARKGLWAFDAALEEWHAPVAWHARLPAQCRLGCTDRAADAAHQPDSGLCAGCYRSEPGTWAERARRHRGRRIAGGACGQLASEGAGLIQHRVRLLLHALRDRRRWAARMAQMERSPEGETFVLVEDDSYPLQNSEIHSSILTARKFIVVVCDNGGAAVIDKLQRGTGNSPFNNLIADCALGVEPFAVNFAAHAEATSAHALRVGSVAESMKRCGRQGDRRAQRSSRSRSIQNAWTEERQLDGKSDWRRQAAAPTSWEPQGR